MPETPAPAPTVDREELRRETLRQAREQMRREEELHREELPRAPHPISMEEVVGRTVDEVMEEQEAGPLLRPRAGPVLPEKTGGDGGDLPAAGDRAGAGEQARGGDHWPRRAF